jgi:AcrR family transcriptional regulator
MAAKPSPDNLRSSAEDTRERILRGAAKAFSEHGFSGATLRDIGESAEINFQSIRHHFGSKEQLWEAVVETLSSRAQEAGLHHEQAIAALPLREQLRAQIRALVAYQVANPDLNRILMREAMKNSERYRKVYPRYVARFLELTGDFLGKLQREGVIKKEIPLEHLVFLFHGALNYRLIAPTDSELYTGKKIDSPEIINQHADALTELLLAD